MHTHTLRQKCEDESIHGEVNKGGSEETGKRTERNTDLDEGVVETVNHIGVESTEPTGGDKKRGRNVYIYILIMSNENNK